MQIVGHVNDVVDDLADVADGKTLEIPVGGRGHNPYQLSIWQTISNEFQKFQISLSITLVTRRYARDIWRSRILPVKVNAIESLVFNELVSQVRLFWSLYYHKE